MKYCSVLYKYLCAFFMVLVVGCNTTEGYLSSQVAAYPTCENEELIEQPVEQSCTGGFIVDNDPWAFDNFTNLRAPQPLFEDTPHGEIAVAHIEFMNDNLYSRLPFTYREKEAAVWIVEELLAMGHSWEHIHVQEFYLHDPFIWDMMFIHPRDMFAYSWLAEDFHLRDFSQNVVLTVPGRSERTIVVGAHYDSLPFPGASDNASGTSLLLESAQRIIEVDNYYTIIYVFFGAEEIGLIGAHVYYNELSQSERDNIALMINADVLFEGEHFVYGSGYATGMEHPLVRPQSGPYQNDTTYRVSAVAQAARDNHGVQISTVPEIVFAPSDHLVFLYHGHPVVFFFGAHLASQQDQFWGLAPYGEDYALTFRVLHSDMDDFHYINENWPDKINNAMWTFSLVLDGLLAQE